jgi:fibronectin type 3 domain-containing protein
MRWQRINSCLRAAYATLIVAFALLLCSQQSYAQKNSLLVVNGQATMIYGANLPWLDGQYDHDIGPNYQHLSWGCAYNHAHFLQYLTDLHAMGANTVRIWLFENMEGLIYNSSNQVTGIDSTFLTNLDDLVNNIAPAAGVKLYFTLISNLSGTPFFNIVTNGDGLSQGMYLTNAVVPLVTRYKGNANIFAFDVENEIEGDIAGSTGNWGTTGTDWTTARAYITAVAAQIHVVDPSRLVTCTSGYHSWSNVQNGLLSGLGLNFYDFHYYADTPSLPDASTMPQDLPCIMGECNQGSSNKWSDSIENTAVTGLIQQTFSSGYSGILVWDYNYPGGTDVHQLLEKTAPYGWRPAAYTIQSNAPGTSPHAPANLSATAYNAQVNLSWSIALNAASYNVKRATTSGGPYTTVGTVSSPSTTTYSDKSVTNNTTYYYVVTSSNSTGESPNSAQVSATPFVPPAPGSLTLSASIGSAQAALTWTASSNATSYNVLRSTTSGGPYTTVVSLGSTATSYTDSGLTNFTTYYYVVQAVNTTATTNSNQVSATPSSIAPPTGLVAYSSGPTLNWTQSPSSPITGNNVYRSTTHGGPYSLVVRLAPATAYTDSTTVKGTVYYYVVTALTSQGESPYSNEASVTSK